MAERCSNCWRLEDGVCGFHRTVIPLPDELCCGQYARRTRSDEERDRDVTKGMDHEEKRAYFARVLRGPGYKLTTAFREWSDRDTQLTIENARWSAWEMICNEGRA